MEVKTTRYQTPAGTWLVRMYLTQPEREPHDCECFLELYVDGTEQLAHRAETHYAAVARNALSGAEKLTAATIERIRAEIRGKQA